MPLSPFVIFLATHLILAPTFSAAIPGFGSGVPAADLVQGRQAADETLVSSSFPARLPPPPPGPLAFKGTKLVDDPAHPWKPLRKGDQRGPCPALNVLASHGYLPRDGVATPAQLIQATQEGFNFENSVARNLAYSAILLTGNLVTDLVSIGSKTAKTGPDTPGPATIAGLNTHNAFEGDASITREDAFFGPNVGDFNQARFDKFKEFSQRYGNGFYNLTVATELRWELFKEGVAKNPEFRWMGLRQASVYGQSAIIANLFVDGRKTGADKGQLDMQSAESIFKDMRFPRGFFRAAIPGSVEGGDVVFNAFPTEPGRNVAGVNSFVVDNSLGGLTDFCRFYTSFVNVIIKELYPNPTGVLLRNLKINLGYFYDSFLFSASACPQVFPYGP